MELTLKDAEVRKVIGDFLDEQLFNYYDAAVIKAAGIPTRKALIEQVITDPKFQKEFTKFLMQYIDRDLMLDAVAEAIDVIQPVFNKVQDTFDEKNAIDRERALQEQDQMAIKRLRARGYKITQ
jgi:hypothetical protein